jgi:hypothetical protein
MILMTTSEKLTKDDNVSIYTLHFPEEAAPRTLNAQVNRWMYIKIIKTFK